ncbi:MAG: MFS transporter, partial [Chloroflexota bacterium]
GGLQRWIGGPAVVRCGFVGLAAGLGWMGLAGAAWALFPAVCLAALGSSLAIPTLTALLSSEAGEERQGAVLGSMAALLSLTQVIGPPLAGFLFDRVGPPAPYLLGSALAGLGLAVFMARSARQAEA